MTLNQFSAEIHINLGINPSKGINWGCTLDKFIRSYSKANKLFLTLNISDLNRKLANI